MDRNIAIGRIMSILISLLIILIGFILSWLMTFSRRREFALMRGFGATGVRVFASFFMEQAILSLAGCLAGCLAFLKLYAGGMMQPLTVVSYLICYLLGTAVSIRMIGKTDLMELLTVRE
jgi:ABC-type lipoprotein release transport system permease subunit